jgi:hypothetical protein
MEVLKGLADSIGRALETLDAEEFSRLSGVFQGRKSAIREKIQAMTAKDVRGIVKKLEKGHGLTNEEMDLVRRWIVGDAEAYAKMETHFDDWIAEFRRLESVVRQEEETGAEEVPDLLRVQGILEDASRIAINLGHCLETQERIRRFEQATEDPSRMDRNLIVQILKLKLSSAET